MERRTIRLALAQLTNTGNRKSNLENSLRLIKEASQNNADIILFPEVHLTEFFPQYPGRDVKKYEIPIDSEIVDAFCRASRENNILSVPNIYLSENGKAYDASILIERDGRILGVQKMVHVAQAEQFYEQDYYTPSDTGFKVWDTELGKIGMTI